MNNKISISIYSLVLVFAYCLLIISRGLCTTPQNLTFNHRNGQTFLTWDDAANAEKYRVYRSTSAISASDLTAANRIAEIDSGSSENKPWNISKTKGNLVADFAQALGTKFFRITDNGTPLTASRELFVWTCQNSGGGSFYYAVTAITGGNEDVSAGAGNMTGPVNETECTMIHPVLQISSSDNTGHVYFIWMPYDKWNPALEGYCYPFYLASQSTSTEKRKVTLGLHGANAHFGKWMTGSPTSPTRVKTAAEAYAGNGYLLRVDDPWTSWHFGFADSLEPFDPASAPDKKGCMAADGSTVYNFAEYRYWCAIRWLCSGLGPFHGDADEVVLLGHSMGGSGCIQFAAHHPEIFAYIEGASEGITNWADDVGWRSRSEKWGGTKNLPCIDLIDHNSLIGNRDVGMSSLGWQSIRDSVLPLLGNQDDITFFNIVHGTRDGSIEWLYHGMPVWKDHTTNGFAKNNIPYSGCWINVGHSNQGSKGANPSSYVPRNHFILALKSAASDDVLEDTCLLGHCEDVGQFNTRVLWSTERDPINGAPIDQSALFETTIKLDNSSIWYLPAYSGPGNPAVDITPRRLQNLIHTPGTQYSWENIPAGSNTAIQSGTVTADQYGLFTIPGFIYTAAGNKLRVSVTGTTNLSVARNVNSEVNRITAMPNPFSTSVDISLVRGASSVVRSGKADIRIFDIRGQLISTLPRTTNYELRTSYRWHAQDQPAGIYIIRVEVGDAVMQKRITLVK
jgi:pimeloyl-ACP methyl ester carboxylesterase